MNKYLLHRLLIASLAHAPEDGSGDAGGASSSAQKTQAPAPAGNTPAAPTSRVFSEENVQAMIDRRLREQEAQYKRQLADLGYEGGLDDLKTQVEQRREEERKRKEEQQKFKDLYEQEKGERARLLAEKDAELERVRQTWRGEKIQRALAQAASNAVNAEQVTRLLAERIRLDEDASDPYPVDQNGKRLTDGNGAYVSVQKFVDSWLEENPHFARAAPGRGANSAPGQAGGVTAPDGFDLNRALTDTEYAVKNAAEFGRLVKNLKL